MWRTEQPHLLEKKKLVTQLPLSSRTHELLRVVCHPPPRPKIPVSGHEKVRTTTIDSHLQQQTEKEWLKILQEVKIMYPEKAQI